MEYQITPNSIRRKIEADLGSGLTLEQTDNYSLREKAIAKTIAEQELCKSRKKLFHYNYSEKLVDYASIAFLTSASFGSCCFLRNYKITEDFGQASISAGIAFATTFIPGLVASNRLVNFLRNRLQNKITNLEKFLSNN